MTALAALAFSALAALQDPQEIIVKASGLS